MQKLEITYQDRLYGHYEKDLKKPYFYLNKSFDIKRLTIDGKDISYSYEDECFIRTFTLPKTGHLVLEYEISLDGSVKDYFPYVKEKTDDPFFILRQETLYYPMLYEPYSEEFYDHVLNRYEEDLFELSIISSYPFSIDIPKLENKYRGYWPNVLFGKHQSASFDFGKVIDFCGAIENIKKQSGLIININDALNKYRYFPLLDLVIYVIPEGYGSFVKDDKTMIITKDSFLDPLYLIHEISHLYWNPICDPLIQACRFFDEGISQYLTLKIADELNIKEATLIKKDYLEAFKKHIKGVKFSPISEYGNLGMGDLSYDVGPLILLKIEESVGEKKMQEVIKRMLNDREEMNFKKFIGLFDGHQELLNTLFFKVDYQEELIKS